MTASPLGPDHKLGSEPQKGANKVWNKRTKALSTAAGGKRYIAGHLLNNNLGGPGNDARNLTAIPATANTQQFESSEKEVKSLVNEEGLFVRYEVLVDYAQDAGNGGLSYASKLTSSWQAFGSDQQLKGNRRQMSVTIPSPTAIAGAVAPTTNVDLGNVVDKAQAAKADMDLRTDVVLNNDGFLRIAATVQGLFSETLKAETAKVAMLGKAAEADRDALQEAEAEIAEMKDLLQETQSELEAKITTLDDLSAENRALKERVEEINASLQDVLRENEMLNEAISVLIEQAVAAELRADLEQTARHEAEQAMIHQEIGRAAAIDVIDHLQTPGTVDAVDPDGLALFDQIRGHLDNLRNSGH